MNKKIKVIDLINMQYKNEKMPKNIRIKYSLVFDYYTYNEEIKWYETADNTTILDVFQKLDYEVEILGDNTEEIEEIDEYEARHEIFTYTGEGEQRSNLYCFSLYTERHIVPKINELVRAINELRKEKSNG